MPSWVLVVRPSKQHKTMAKRVNNIAYKGINHSPSLVSDNDGHASECVNLSPDFNDLKPMPMPVKMAGGYQVTDNARLVFVHQGVGYENYIELDADGQRLYLRDKDGNYLYFFSNTHDWRWWTNFSDVIAIEAVGNTLVVSTKEGTEYILYQPDVPLGQASGSYKPIGQKPQMPVIEFRLHEDDEMHKANIRFSGESDLLILGGFETVNNTPVGEFSYFILQRQEAEITDHLDVTRIHQLH